MVAALMLGIGGHLVALTVDFAIGPVVGRADTGFGEQVSDEIVRIGQLIPHLWQECGAAATTVGENQTVFAGRNTSSSSVRERTGRSTLLPSRLTASV